MAHRTTKSAYHRLTDRINRFPQGAPPAKHLYQILRMLFNEKEAELTSQLPIRPFTVRRASKIWKTGLAESRKALDSLAEKGLLIDIEIEGEIYYVLPPPMAGFFEFSMMRVRGDIDQKALSELFYHYLNIEEDFISSLFTVGETQMGRTFVNEPSLAEDNALHVLDYERASEVISTASHIGVSMCYCRHKMLHLDRNCEAPMDICMTFNTAAASLIRSNIARKVDKTECRDLLDLAYEQNLVQFGENVRQGVNFICNCCCCCCEAMIAARRFAILNPVHTTSFIPRVNTEACTGCGRCVNVCPVEAMSLTSANDPRKPKKKKAVCDDNLCLGCAVRVRACTKGNISLTQRPKRTLTPLNGAHRTVLMAIERGKLQNLIFDNHLLFSHRAMAAVLGVILRLPPVKQLLANEQFNSRYLEKLIAKFNISG